MFLTLYANYRGEILEIKDLGMLGQSGPNWVEPEEKEMIPLPEGASLVTIPDFQPVGLDAGGNSLLYTGSSRPERQASAVAALLPQGFTRTLLPACASPRNSVMPILGYAAVGFKDGQIYVAAMQSDDPLRWNPEHYNTADLPDLITRIRKKYPRNRIFKQLATCASCYGCFTAQNVFYRRWEGGIPTTRTCNAACIACISESHMGVDSPQQRIEFSPEVEEIAQVGIHHLQNSRQAIISFGQGCEGEPSLNARRLSHAMGEIRQAASQGTINCNSNAGYTAGIKEMTDAGLDALRVTLFSARDFAYEYYHRPRNYSLKDVEASICYAREKGVYVSLNLLVFPGYTDREGEIEALLELVERCGIQMVQLRNLNIDPGVLFRGLPEEGYGLGIPALVTCLEQGARDLVIGSFSHPVRD